MSERIIWLSDGLEEWLQQARRCLINGPPYSGKSTSLRTWETPVVIQSFPGEKGTTSLPRGPGFRACRQVLPSGDLIDWGNVIAEMRRTTAEILSGKHGDLLTYAGDGIHKAYGCFLNEVTNGAAARGEDFDPRLFGKSSARFFRWLDTILESPVKNVVLTCWDGHEKDDPDERGANPSRHIFPELPGQAAKRIMGEFAVVLYATRQGSGPSAQYVWQTQPFGKVWGAGTKMPLEIARRVPVTVPQDWSALEKFLIPQEEGKP